MSRQGMTEDRAPCPARLRLAEPAAVRRARPRGAAARSGRCRPGMRGTQLSAPAEETVRAGRHHRSDGLVGSDAAARRHVNLTAA
jgi:hypothetical protein